MSELQFFRRFTDSNELDEISSLLNQVNIEHQLSFPSSPPSDVVGPSGLRYFELYIRDADFDKVNILLKARALEITRNIAIDHYLFTFSDTELLNILAHPNEWSELDVQLSAQILEDRKKNTLPAIPDEGNTELIPNTESDENNAEDPKQNQRRGTVIILVILLIASVYYYHHREPVTTNDVVSISAKIAGKPKYVNYQDGPPYVTIRLIGYEKSFRIKGCAMIRVDKETLLNLSSLDEIELLVSRADLNEKNSRVAEISGVEINGFNFLTLDDFNDCEKREFQLILILIPVVLLCLLLTKIIRK